MTIAPLFDSPCDLAERIPSMVSDFLDLENKIKRRFREDSVTDIIIASLLRISGGNATVASTARGRSDAEIGKPRFTSGFCPTSFLAGRCSIESRTVLEPACRNARR